MIDINTSKLSQFNSGAHGAKCWQSGAPIMVAPWLRSLGASQDGNPPWLAPEDDAEARRLPTPFATGVPLVYCSKTAMGSAIKRYHCHTCVAIPKSSFFNNQICFTLFCSFNSQLLGIANCLRLRLAYSATLACASRISASS